MVSGYLPLHTTATLCKQTLSLSLSLSLVHPTEFIHFSSAAVAVDYDCVSHHPHRVVDSVRLQVLVVGTCRQCGSWSDAGHNHIRNVIGRDRICTSLHDMETVRQRPCTTREIETWLSDNRVGYSSVFCSVL